jgi:hypothetical protein
LSDENCDLVAFIQNVSCATQLALIWQPRAAEEEI